MNGRSYKGSAIDGTVQYLSEAPHWQGDGETVDVVDDEPVGEDIVEGVPVPGSGDRRPDVEEQTTLEDWGWSA